MTKNISISTTQIIKEIEQYESNCFITGKITGYKRVFFANSLWIIQCQVWAPGSFEINVLGKVSRDSEFIPVNIDFIPNGKRYEVFSKPIPLTDAISSKVESLFRAYHRYLSNVN